MAGELGIKKRLRERLGQVRERIAAACQRVGRSPADVRIIAVTKSVSLETARHLLELDVADLAENRPQQLWPRQAALTQARWHLIGHLQRNKIDRTLPGCSLIHSVDSERLLAALDAWGRNHGRPVPVLLQFNCSREPNKTGFAPEMLPALADKLPNLTGVEVRGLMTMAAHEADPERCRPTFAELRTLRDRLRARCPLSLDQLSMGMSNDFVQAVEEGATMVRLGTVLFEGIEQVAA